MIDEPPPLPAPEPPPLPTRQKVAWPLGLLLIPLVALVALYLGPLRIEVHFIDDAGRVPGPFEVTLRSGNSEKKTLVEKGRLNLLRGRWQDFEITDDFYVRTTEKVHGGEMQVTIERNELLKLKQASNGHPSVPQGNDPDPKND